MIKRATGLIVAVGLALLGWTGLMVAQSTQVSSGGAFQPRENYVVSGIWTFVDRLSPWVIEGVNEDNYETTITFAEPTSDNTITFPDADLTIPALGGSGAFLGTTLTTNNVDVASSIWGTSAGLVFEGATADGSETTLAVADPTADITIQFRTDSADTYYALTMPDGDITSGHFQMPDNGGADTDLTMTDEALYVYRVYIPNWITVANVYARTTQGADVAGSDDILGVAIYEDADAGAQLTEAVSADITATANVTFNVTDVTLGPGFYRIAVCSGDGSGATFVADTTDDEFIDVANLGTVTIGTGANACVSGNPPATTGAVSTADINYVVLKLGA